MSRKHILECLSRADIACVKTLSNQVSRLNMEILSADPNIDCSKIIALRNKYLGLLGELLISKLNEE